MSAARYLALIIIVDVVFLLYAIQNISISYEEAVIFFDEHNFLHYVIQFSTYLFGQNDYALRLPFVFFHIGSIILMYFISTFYLKRQSDRLMSVLIFTLLPGVTSAAILVNSATVAIFFTLLFIYLYLRKLENYYAFLLPLLVFVDDSFIILFLSLFVYGFFKKDRFLMIMSASLVIISLYMYGFKFTNTPKVYFFDLFAVYGLIFSPLLFLYFFYTMYRILIKENKTIIWYISFVALITSIILSFSQMILIEEFAPFVVIATPLMYSMFIRSFRIRLPELRRTLKFFFSLIFISLILIFGITHLNKYLYRYISNPTKHFAYQYYIAKELAAHLKKHNTYAVMADTKMQKRLKFYGIGRDTKYMLNENQDTNTRYNVTISYINTPVKTYYVSKVHIE